MLDVKVALERFLAGELDSAALQAILRQAVVAEPQRAAEYAEALQSLYRAGRLPQPLFLLLNAGLQPDQAEDRTRVVPPAAGTPPTTTRTAAEDDPERTRVLVPPAARDTRPSADDDERTRVATMPTSRTAPVTGRTATGRTAPVTGQHTGQHTGQTTGQSTSAGWTDPAQWQNESGSDEVLSVGSIIKGRFVLESVVGKGGMGLVYKARDLRKEEAQDRNPYIAVKLLNEDFKRHPESLKALQREARKAQNLAHPNIVNVFDFDRDGSNVYMTMEFLEGEPLDKIIKRLNKRGMPEKEAMPIIHGLSAALSYAHKKHIIHSDFKPGNAFLNQDGVIKVFDFGIARAAKRSETAEGETTLFDAGSLGALTPAYASCEMLEGEEPDPRDDIYALACVAYELLAGKHPFNKISATQARDNRLVPAPIKGLNRRQWKGLLRGLAFSRDQRSASVDQFLDELERKKSWLGIGIAAAVAGLVVIGLLLRGPIEAHFQKKDADQVIAGLRSNNETEVEAALTALKDMHPEQRDAISRELREEIIAYFEKRIDMAIDASQNRYDYPRAEALLARARELYPDSASVEAIVARVEQRKNQLLNELNAKFNDYLEQGRLLVREDAEDINDVLAIIAQIDPQHALLKDARLPNAYASAAEQAVQGEDYAQALNLLTAGLGLFPDDTRLVNIQDKAKQGQARVARAAEIADLQTRLANVELRQLADVTALRDPMLRLKELSPDDEVLARLRGGLQSALTPLLADQIAQMKWQAAEDELDQYGDLLPSDYITAQRAAIAQAKAGHEARISDLFAAIGNAVKAGRLESPAGDNALELLARAAESVPDDARLAQGRAAIAQAYLQQAREARAKADWKLARERVQRGIEIDPGSAVQASLNAETQEIDRAEQEHTQQLAQADREQRAQALQAKVDGLRQSFNEQLAQSGLNIDAARNIMQTLDQLAAANPADVLVSQGRGQIADKLAQTARGKAIAGDWEGGFKLLNEAMVLIPESASLPRTLAELKKNQAEQQTASLDKALQARKANIQAMLAQPELSDAWDGKLRQELRELSSKLPANDPWLSDVPVQVAKLYLAKAQEMHKAQRFTEAYGMLDRGKRHAPLREIEAERQLVSADEAKFEAQSQEQNRLAQVKGMQQTLLTQAKANDVKNAKATLDKLAAELPANDVFLTDTGPQALGDAYLRLAERLAKRKQYDKAMQLVESGLEIAPQFAPLKEAGERYSKELGVQSLRNAVSASPFKAEELRKGMQAYKAEQPGQYAALEKDIAESLRQRIETLARDDFDAGKTLLTQAQQALPGNALLSALVLTPPATPVPEPAPAVPSTPVKEEKKTEAKPVDKTSTVVKKAAPGEDPCSASFAGYGKRARATCSDDLGGDKGPVLVVVPAGGGNGNVFAIGKYEVSVGEFNFYCRQSGKCSPLSADPQLPATRISYQQSKAYLAWLSDVSGRSYRLPTDAEWQYAANAGGSQPEKDFNCLLRLGDQVVKGLSLINVKSGKANGWGLVNYVGNAQEWVSSGGARGGAYLDSLSSCDVSLSKQHSGSPDEATGFRVLREMGPTS